MTLYDVLGTAIALWGVVFGVLFAFWVIPPSEDEKAIYKEMLRDLMPWTRK
jgi:hypothetical protein